MKKQPKHRLPSHEPKKTSAPKISVWRFGIVYVVLMGAFFLLIGLKSIQNIIDLNGLYTKGVVLLTSKVLKGLTVPATFQGSIIQLPSVALDVRFGCNGLEAVMIYSIAVIAFPALWRHKLLGIIAGFLVIQVINILRIACLAYSAVYLKNLFEYIHIYIAQGMMIAVSLGVFFIYLNYAKSSPKANA
jgi:exosortase/archaeosortase family protein